MKPKSMFRNICQRVPEILKGPVIPSFFFFFFLGGGGVRELREQCEPLNPKPCTLNPKP